MRHRIVWAGLFVLPMLAATAVCADRTQKGETHFWAAKGLEVQLPPGWVRMPPPNPSLFVAFAPEFFEEDEFAAHVHLIVSPAKGKASDMAAQFKVTANQISGKAKLASIGSSPSKHGPIHHAYWPVETEGMKLSQVLAGIRKGSNAVILLSQCKREDTQQYRRRIREIAESIAFVKTWQPKTLAEARGAHKTVLREKGPSPQEFDADLAPPKGIEEVTYSSGSLKLKAWLHKPKVEGKRPALVFAHGGFAFGAEDMEQLAAFMKAGFVVMCPMFRGENGNPGHFEFYGGEVEDLIAAGNYVSKLPQVDPKRIYMAGHSSGATLVILASMLPSPYAAGMASGGYPDGRRFFMRWWQDAPFNLPDEREIMIRSAMHFPGCLRIPLHLCVGGEDEVALTGNKAFAALASKNPKTKDLCQFVPLKGDHMTAVEPSLAYALEKFGAGK